MPTLAELTSTSLCTTRATLSMDGTIERGADRQVERFNLPGASQDKFTAPIKEPEVTDTKDPDKAADSSRSVEPRKVMQPNVVKDLRPWAKVIKDKFELLHAQVGLNKVHTKKQVAFHNQPTCNCAEAQVHTTFLNHRHKVSEGEVTKGHHTATDSSSSVNQSPVMEPEIPENNAPGADVIAARTKALQALEGTKHVHTHKIALFQRRPKPAQVQGLLWNTHSEDGEVESLGRVVETWKTLKALEGNREQELVKAQRGRKLGKAGKASRRQGRLWD